MYPVMKAIAWLENANETATILVKGTGSAFRLEALFQPTSPVIHRLLLPNGHPAELVSRGQALILEGEGISSSPELRVHAGGILIDPDLVEPGRIYFRLPARAYDRRIFIRNEHTTSNELQLPLIDPDPGGIGLISTHRDPADIAIRINVDPHWRLREIESRIEAGLFECSLDLNWKIAEYVLMVNLYILHVTLPEGVDRQAYGRSVTQCLSRRLDRGILLVAW